MKTIDIIKDLCENRKNEFLSKIEPNIYMGLDLEKTTKSLDYLKTEMNNFLDKLGHDIDEIINKSNEDYQTIREESSKILEETSLSVFSHFM
jgi:division protein CdvB (Snf7/Vps24/ESCRT-III family)